MKKNRLIIIGFLILGNFRICFAQDPDMMIIQDRLDQMEERLNEVYNRAVLSEPKLFVKKRSIWVCENGHEYFEKQKGDKCSQDDLELKQSFTYQRERVYRRQTISEVIEGVLAEEESRGVTIGVSSTGTIHQSLRLKGDRNEAKSELFGIGSVDLFFVAKPAMFTSFFLDLEAIGGFSPDDRIANNSGLNSDSARYEEDERDVNIREAWLRTELFKQTLVLSGGMLDLTNYFDNNMAANDETTQFITDTLVNNPFLTPPTNGGGLVAIYDPKMGFTLKAGVQRGETASTNFTNNTYSIFEASYLANFSFIPQGNYRAWYRINDDTKRENMAWGISIDQQLTRAITVFARFGQQFTSNEYDRDDFFYSGGVDFKTPFTFYLQDSWGLGYERSDMAIGEKEDLLEVYYNLALTDNIQTSLHVQYLINSDVGGENKSYVIPGIRVQITY